MNMAFPVKYKTLLYFWELQDYLTRFFKYHVVFKNSKYLNQIMEVND